MRWWDNIFNRGRNAQDWDAHKPDDDTVAELQALFESAREDAPEPDDKLWEKLRPQLAAHEGQQAQGALSFISVVAATGPRFAAAALGILLLAAGLLWNQGVERQARILERQAAVAFYTDRNPLNPIVMIGGELEAQRGEDLLQFVAYGTPER
ncbi:MAG: hypothetical protein OXE44_09845 [Nitrospinae bacterium]|nr:hypothetical protein [Nitrospinota bacterium]